MLITALIDATSTKLAVLFTALFLLFVRLLISEYNSSIIAESMPYSASKPIYEY